MQEQQIISNKIRTPDGTILRSRRRYDYQTHKDKNGFKYVVDGGLDYLRRNYNEQDPYEELSVYSDAPHEILREECEWGSYGKDGDMKLHYIKVADMDAEHLRAVVSMKNVNVEYRCIMIRELEDRDGKNE